MPAGFEQIAVGDKLEGTPFLVSRETIRSFAEASLDFNPLHFDDKYMERTFGKTHFRGVIAHGMGTFAQMTRMMTDWLLPRGGMHRRMEARWVQPVYPGDEIRPRAVVSQKIETAKGRWLVFELTVENNHGEVVATGEAMAECPGSLAG